MPNWLRRLMRPSRPLGDVRIVMYTRPGCHLCDDARQLLEAEQAHHRYHLEFVDISNDEALARVHGDSIPVVAVNGTIRFRGVINRVLLRRLLGALH